MKHVATIYRIAQVYPRIRCGVLAWAALLISGCAGMVDIKSASSFMESYSQGEYLLAAESLGGETALDYDEGNLLTSLQVGIALRAAGGYEGLKSHSIVRNLSFCGNPMKYRASMSCSPPDSRWSPMTWRAPYQGNIYDGVLVNTFKAMNAVYLGDPDRARIELNRAEQRQTNAVEQLAVKVRALGEGDPEEDENRKAQAEQIDGALADALKPDSPVGKRLAAVEALGEYRDLRNPFTEWLHGVFRLATGEANRASNLFRDAAVLDGRNNQHVLADLLLAETTAGSAVGAPDRVWIVHEDGTGPYLDEFRFDFSVVTPNGVIVTGIALPEFVRGTPAVGALAVTADGQDYRTEPLLDVDRYAATEFRAGYSAIAGKAVAGAVIRTILQAVAQKEASERGGLAAALLNFGSTVASVTMTRADTRMWHSLPKSVGVASLARPSDGRLLITISDGRTIYDDILPPGRFALVTVKSVRQGALPTIHVAAFGD